MIIFPNAKINLGLKIVGRRDDGYHNISTVFYPVNIKDALEVVEADKLTFTSTGIPIPGDPAENLCLKAWHLLSKDFHLPKVHIHLHKQIPVGAGLGGGSADAAFCIRLLNEKFKMKLTTVAMENYARSLGADCAFFIKNKTVVARGKGDEFSSIELNLDKYFKVLVMPPFHVQTGEAYRGIQPSGVELTPDLLRLPPEKWRNVLVNDFEKPVFEMFPQIEKIKEALYGSGALYASMSGSGASVYGLFSAEVKLSDLEEDNLVFYGI
ncbi:4-(cytidine 5'-diphospho)-2-C-methyl-D-erythritol kinase [Flavihumibacter sp. R14]|nr:4-(cytidine 5'-diphospho)-2-C-methyl-D-erythritol kinase [Flavihumibacter soli]